MAPHANGNGGENGFHKSNDPSSKDGKALGPATAAGTAGLTGSSLATSKAMETTSGAPRKRTYLERHPEEKKGWSRGKKICCGLLLLFLAILITLGVLIAFMVRVPSIEYKRAQFICPGGNYLTCAQEQVQALVFLEVDNPNILGATINADLALYNDPALGGQYLGPGSVGDTHVGKRGQTELQALFNITSSETYGLLQRLFIDRREVILQVKGTVYVHVGLLRPSVQFEEKFTVPPQDISSTIGDALDGIDIPSIGDVIGSLDAPSSGDVTGAIVDQIPDDAPAQVVGAIPGVPSVITDNLPNIRAADGAVANTPQAANAAAGTIVHTTRATEAAPPKALASTSTSRTRHPALRVASSGAPHPPALNARAIRAALAVVGPPGSPQREQFEREEKTRRRRTPAQKTLIGGKSTRP